MIHYYRLRVALRRLRWLALRWLDDNLPAQCPACGLWYPGRRGWVPARHRIAGWVRICRGCFEEMYGEDLADG